MTASGISKSYHQSHLFGDEGDGRGDGDMGILGECPLSFSYRTILLLFSYLCCPVGTHEQGLLPRTIYYVVEIEGIDDIISQILISFKGTERGLFIHSFQDPV